MHQKFIAGKHFITQSRPHMYKLHNSILFSREETIYFHRLFRKQKNPVQTRKKNLVDQTRNFKLENVKNQVQIDRGFE